MKIVQIVAALPNQPYHVLALDDQGRLFVGELQRRKIGYEVTWHQAEEK